MQIDQRIGANINLRLRLQRDIAIKKNNKLANVIIDLRKLVEHGKETK